MAGLRGWRRAAVAVVLGATVVACSGATGEQAAPGAAPVSTSVPASTAAPPSPGPPATPLPAEPPTTTPAPAPTVPPPTTAPPPPAPSPRRVTEQAWTPFAVVDAVVLSHPSARVERVAFHESNHDGARELSPVVGAADPVVLETRERGTGAQTAADVVVDPDVEIRAPVSGRVIRAGTYVLYCDHRDDFAVIEPDARPGWEVKILHIDGVVVRPGDRTEAGITVVAPRPTRLPFESQVDEVTADPAWPHVHIEVVDPSIPDRPSGGGC